MPESEPTTPVTVTAPTSVLPPKSFTGFHQEWIAIDPGDGLRFSASSTAGLGGRTLWLSYTPGEGAETIWHGVDVPTLAASWLTALAAQGVTVPDGLIAALGPEADHA